MQRVLRLTLLFASSMGALDARPHSNYGFYSPYPPPPEGLVEADGRAYLPDMHFTVTLGQAQNRLSK